MEFRPARKAERLSNCLDHLPGEIELAVKTRPSCPWTKRPRELYCSLAFESLFQLFRIGGKGCHTVPLSVKYLSLKLVIITLLPHKNPAKGHCLVGSLTGEVDSYSATELHKGWLFADGNGEDSVKA